MCVKNLTCGIQICKNQPKNFHKFDRNVLKGDIDIYITKQKKLLTSQDHCKFLYFNPVIDITEHFKTY